MGKVIGRVDPDTPLLSFRATAAFTSLSSVATKAN